MGIRRPLWLIFVAAAAILVAMTFVVSETTRHAAAVAEVTRLGGNVQTTQGGPDWLRRIVGHRLMSVFDRDTVVNLGGTETTDADLEVLTRLRGVERLSLAGTQVTDVGMAQIGRLTGLKALDLGGTGVTDDGIAQLERLSALEFLYLDGTEVTDAGLHHLEHLHHLRTLAVEGTAVTEPGVAGQVR